MAELSSSYHFDSTQQTPGSEGHPSFARLFHPCRTPADVHARTTMVRAFRARNWPSQRPRPSAPSLTAPPQPALKPVAIAHRMAMPSGRFLVRQVIEAVASHFGHSVADMISGSQRRPLVHHRQLAMFLAVKLSGRSYPYVGRHLGNRDNSTIRHGYAAVERRIAEGDTKLAADVDAIVSQLTGGAA